MSRTAANNLDAHAATQTAPDDTKLVRRTLDGQTDAFDELVERYQRRAVSVAHRLLGNLHDAMEVSQEAFVRAFRNLDSLENQNRFGSWLLRIVTNLSLNFRRDRAAGKRNVSLDESPMGEHGASEGRWTAWPGDEDFPGGDLAAEELREIVQNAISRLPEAQRTALVLFSLEQLPQKDVAGIMNCSVEAVKWHVFQARKSLRQTLAEYI